MRTLAKKNNWDRSNKKIYKKSSSKKSSNNLNSNQKSKSSYEDINYNFFIDDTAKIKFKEYIKTMDVAKEDEPLLLALSNSLARYIELEKDVSREGIVIMSEKGTAYQNPRYNALQATIKTLTTLSKEFGLSVASRKRAGIALKKPKEENSLFDMKEDDFEIKI